MRATARRMLLAGAGTLMLAMGAEAVNAQSEGKHQELLLEALGAFELIMGLRAPDEGGVGVGADGGGGGDGGRHGPKKEHARSEGAWGASSGRRDVKRGGAKGRSHLPSEVLPLAVAEEEEGAETNWNLRV